MLPSPTLVHPDGQPLSGEPCYTYVVVRTDIPVADQMVQVAHACLEAAWRFPRPWRPCHLVLLGIPSQEALCLLATELKQISIDAYTFHEPDDALGYTALCTAPLIQRPARRVFKSLAFWSPP